MNISPVVPSAVWEWVKIKKKRKVREMGTTADVCGCDHVEGVQTDGKTNEQREREKNARRDSENEQVDRLAPSM